MAGIPLDEAAEEHEELAAVLNNQGVERPALEVLTKDSYHKEFVGNHERQECVVPMDWAETRPLSGAIIKTGMFGNQNTVCAPKTPKCRRTAPTADREIGQFVACPCAGRPARSRWCKSTAMKE